jgi:hypothetical protein
VYLFCGRCLGNDVDACCYSQCNIRFQYSLAISTTSSEITTDTHKIKIEPHCRCFKSLPISKDHHFDVLPLFLFPNNAKTTTRFILIFSLILSFIAVIIAAFILLYSFTELLDNRFICYRWLHLFWLISLLIWYLFHKSQYHAIYLKF